MTGPVSVLKTKLAALVNNDVVVVMQDNRAFRGTLVEHDDDAIVLRNVVEGVPVSAGGWEEVTVSTGIIDKVVTWNGVFSHDDNNAELVRLKDVIILTRGVLRIWEYSATNIGKPEHVGRAERDTDGPARRISRRG